MTCDFNIWMLGVPVVTVAGNPDFNIWLLNVPICDTGASLGGQPPPRRRVIEF